MKKLPLLLLALLPTLCAIGQTPITSAEKRENDVLIKNDGGESLSVQIVTDDIIRIRKTKAEEFKESAMIKFGFVYDNFPECDFDLSQEGDNVTISTSNLRIIIEKATSAIAIFDKNGKRLLQESNQGAQTEQEGSLLSFTMNDDEHYFGFGFMRDLLDARGHKLTFTRKYRWNGATIPYFMSTNGYAFYSNTVFNHDFDFTEKQGDQNYYTIATPDSQIDYYIINGPSFASMLDRYTDLTGKSVMVPRWAFGAQYRFRYFGDQYELVRIAKMYRDKEIPCDIMALEPGWEEEPYSMKWQWSKERFPEPEKMLDTLHSYGFKFDLWESGIAPSKNFSDAEVRKEWFSLREDIIKMGVDMFKQDDPYPRSIISQDLSATVLSDSKYHDLVLTAQEANNVCNTFYSQTLFDEYRKLTDKRAVVMFHAYNASVATHRWPFQWAGDFQAANGMINASLSGHAMVSYDIRNPYAAGWHQGFFTPFTVVDSWAYYREPWLYAESIEQSHRLYACLRSRLVPYIYSSMWQAHTTAMPIERPMVMEYTDDPQTYNMHTQYMFGDWFLVGLSDSDDSPAGEQIDFWAGVEKGNYGKIYLPKGRWIDYWTGKEREMTKSSWIESSWPEYCGGMLFVKAGAIIPQGQVKEFIGETQDEIITLDIYPYKKSSYQLYEDDGESYNYEKGEYSTVDITSNQSEEKTEITISARKGEYTNAPERRSYILKVLAKAAPTEISVDGVKLTYFKRKEDILFSSANNGWYYDAEQKKAIIKLDKGWKYEYLDDEGDPMSNLPATAKYERVLWDDSTACSQSDRSIIITPADPNAKPDETTPTEIPTSLEAKVLNKTFIADNQNILDILFTLRDEQGNKVMHPDYEILEVSISGEATNISGADKMRVKLIDGEAKVSLQATTTPGEVSVKAKCGKLKSTKISCKSTVGTLQVRCNPPEKVNLKSESWIPNSVSVFVNIKTNDKVVRNASNIIILNVYDKEGNLCATYNTTAEKGEAIFKDITYYSRPAQCLFEIKCDGFETVTKRIFENTWDLPTE